MEVTNPLIPRRAIARVLRDLRESSGKLLSDVAKDLMISTSKLSRLENAQGKPLARDIRDLSRYYGVSERLAGRLQQLVKDAQTEGWWTSFDEEIFEAGLDAHLAFETDAVVERAYTIPFLPALLQSPAYARALFRDMEQRPEAEVDQKVEVRARRQQALTSRPGLAPLRLIAVTHESSLHQVIGGPETMSEQLRMLIKLSQKNNVELHVLPFSAPPMFSMACMYAHFEYPDADLEQGVVHVETHAGFISIEDPPKVARYRAAHERLVRASLSQDESRALIEGVCAEMAADAP